MQKALSLEISSLVSRPELTVQSLYNRLIWFDDLEPVLSEQLKAARSNLDQLPFWIRVAAPLPAPTPGSDLIIPFEFSTSIQSLAPDGSAIAIANAKGETQIYSLKTGVKLEERKLGSKSLAAVALCENPRRLAWMDTDGYVQNGEGMKTLRGRCGEHRLLYHPQGGIIGVQEDHALVAWQPAKDKVTVLFENLPAPLSVLRFSSDENYIVYVAGSNPIFMGIINWNGEEWKTENIPFVGVPVVDLDYDPETRDIAILQKNRCVSIMNMSRKVLSQTFYEAESQGQIIGYPVHCAIGKGDQSGKVFLCTHQGQIAVWNWQNEELDTYANCFSKFNLQSFCFLVTLPASHKVFYSTDIMGGTISQQAKNTNSVFHQSEVLTCVITSNNHIVSAGKQDNRLKWFTADGLTMLNERLVKDVSVINSCTEGDQVLVGDRYGRVWIQFPHKEATLNETQHVFNGPVKGAFMDGSKTGFASEEKGQVVFFDDYRTKIYRHQNFNGNFIKILPAQENGLFWVLSEDVEGVDGSSITHIKLELTKEDGVETLFRSRELLHDFAVNHDGNLVCLAIASMDGGVDIQVLRKEKEGWKICGQRKTSSQPVKRINRVGFLDQASQLIAITYNDAPWLEILETTGELNKVAEVMLPHSTTCMVASRGFIVIGCQSGQLISYHLERRM